MDGKRHVKTRAERAFSWQIRGRGVSDAAVLSAMETVPREAFVPADRVDQAYDDRPLPIGHGQTISQPYIVAAMTETLMIGPTSRVLEIGTGSGYQTAVLAEIAQAVYTVERVGGLARRARETLTRLGYANIRFCVGDGALGWPEQAPFDGILVTCAPERVPSALLDQLADRGRMVIPLGRRGGLQALWRLERRGDHVERERLMGVAFVPLISDAPEKVE